MSTNILAVHTRLSVFSKRSTFPLESTPCANPSKASNPVSVWTKPTTWSFEILWRDEPSGEYHQSAPPNSPALNETIHPSGTSVESNLPYEPVATDPCLISNGIPAGG